MLTCEYEQELTIMLIASQRDMQKTLLNVLSAKMFTHQLFRKVFEICEHLLKAEKEINVFSVCELLKNKRDIEDVNFLQKNFITNINYNFYVQKIQQSYFNRLTKNAQSYEEIRLIQNEADKYTDISDLCDISHNAQELLTTDYENQKNIKTGYPSIDSKLGCMQGGDLIILAGATGMGKTCTMVNLVASMANLGLKIDVFSLEMSLKQLQNRLVCSQTRVDASKLRKQSFEQYEFEIYNKYVKEVLPTLPIKVCTNYRITVEDIRNRVKKSDSDAVFVDYLKLIQGNNLSLYERISDISRELKLTAVETNKPFVVLHSLNRAIADRQDKTPKLSDLRDSGNIEYDADTVCFVHRPAYYEPEKCKKWELQFVIGKSRHTASNQKVELFYDENTQTVKEK